MTKKNPDKRELNHLKKVETEKQSKRLRAAQMVKGGYSYRKAADILGTIHQFVYEWSHKLLYMKLESRKVDGKIVQVRVYEFKEEYLGLLATRKPGPAPGNCPKS